jgi:hypothetical protein
LQKKKEVCRKLAAGAKKIRVANNQPWIRLRKPLPTPAAGSIQKTAGSGKDGVDTSRTSQKDKISLAPQKPPCARRFFTASNRRDAACLRQAGIRKFNGFVWVVWKGAPPAPRALPRGKGTYNFAPR